MDQGLSREERLRGRRRIGRIYDEGARATSGRLVIRALPNGLDHSRIMAAAGKALGNAVKRNRMRRLIRAAFRIQKDLIPKGWDLVMMARTGILEAKWQDVLREVRGVAERIAGSAAGQNRRRRRQ